jgi:hypothetical protein
MSSKKNLFFSKKDRRLVAEYIEKHRKKKIDDVISIDNEPMIATLKSLRTHSSESPESSMRQTHWRSLMVAAKPAKKASIDDKQKVLV